MFEEKICARIKMTPFFSNKQLMTKYCTLKTSIVLFTMFIFLKKVNQRNEKQYLITQTHTFFKKYIKCHKDTCYAYYLLSEASLHLFLTWPRFTSRGREGGKRKKKQIQTAVQSLLLSFQSQAVTKQFLLYVNRAS